MNVVSAGVARSLQTHTVLHNCDGVSVRKRIAGAVVPDPDRCNHHHHHHATRRRQHCCVAYTLHYAAVAVDHTTTLTVYNIDL